MVGWSERCIKKIIGEGGQFDHNNLYYLIMPEYFVTQVNCCFCVGNGELWEDEDHSAEVLIDSEMESKVGYGTLH